MLNNSSIGRKSSVVLTPSHLSTLSKSKHAKHPPQDSHMKIIEQEAIGEIPSPEGEYRPVKLYTSEEESIEGDPLENGMRLAYERDL
jgi:hypothetical protein